MNTTRIPTGATGRAAGVGAGCGPACSQTASWEYKVAILAAGTAPVPVDLQQQFRDGLGRQGWIFISENRGILHFKRPKRPGLQA
jgi:hypothetical protein